MDRALPSSEYSTMFGKSFQIYSVRVLENEFCETPPPWHDLIISPPM